MARTAHGLDRGAGEGNIDLLAKVAHVHLDDVGVALEVVVPDVIENVLLRQHRAEVANQQLEHCELSRCQLDLDVAPPGSSLVGVDP